MSFLGIASQFVERFFIICFMQYNPEDMSKRSAAGIVEAAKIIEEAVKKCEVYPAVAVEIGTSFVANLMLETKKKNLEYIDQSMAGEMLQDTLCEYIIGSKSVDFDDDNGILKIIFVAGLCGVGKTTFCAKLANLLAASPNSGKFALASIDKKRPGSQMQLKHLAHSIGAYFIQSQTLHIIQKIISELKQEAMQLGVKTLIIDTPGYNIKSKNLHIMLGAINNMSGITKIMVVDGFANHNTIHDSISLAQKYQMHGIAITKCDAANNINAITAISSLTNIPITHIINGEAMEYIELFRPQYIVKLWYKEYYQAISKAVKAALFKCNLHKKNIIKSHKPGTFHDLMANLQGLNKITALLDIIHKMPNSVFIKNELNNIDLRIKHYMAIISAMTDEEKYNPNLIDRSRITRIASGSGLKTEDVETVMMKLPLLHKTASLH